MHRLRELLIAPTPLTVAVAESVTCGRIQARLGAISGASRFFLGGITAYTLEQKIRHLGVERAGAAVVNSVSEAVAVQMAQGACRLFGADLALATTGYAEPSVEWNVAAPFGWWALVQRRGGSDPAAVIATGCVDCPDLERVAVQDRIAETAIAALVRYALTLRGT